MNLYRQLVPQTTRVLLRNIQYRINQLIFNLKYFFIKKNAVIPQKTKKPSICYLIPTTNITGGVAVVCEHLNRLQKLGYHTLIATHDNKTDLSWFPKQKVKVIPLKKNKGEIEEYDIVVATGWITAYDLMLISARRKIYFVQSDETRFYPSRSFLKKRVENTYKFPFEFMTEAKWIKKWLKKDFGKDAFYVPNGINTDIFYPDKPIEPKPKNKKRVLLEGAINLPFKGMAEAFTVVKDLNCEVWCVSYDGKPKPEWRCDRFFEKVPMSTMRRIYSSCDILLKLSKVEGFFGPPLEMMACGGVPVVAKVTGYDEYIVNNYNALVVNQNPDQTKNTLKKLLTNDKLINELKKDARQTVKGFSWDNSINKLQIFYTNDQHHPKN